MSTEPATEQFPRDRDDGSRVLWQSRAMPAQEASEPFEFRGENLHPQTTPAQAHQLQPQT